MANVLAALEPLICTCALRTIDATLYMIRVSASELLLHKRTPDVPNSTCSGVGISLATSTSKHLLWVQILLLATCTSLGRFILSDIKPRNRASGAQGWTRTTI